MAGQHRKNALASIRHLNKVMEHHTLSLRKRRWMKMTFVVMLPGVLFAAIVNMVYWRPRTLHAGYKPATMLVEPWDIGSATLKRWIRRRSEESVESWKTNSTPPCLRRPE